MVRLWYLGMWMSNGHGCSGHSLNEVSKAGPLVDHNLGGNQMDCNNCGESSCNGLSRFVFQPTCHQPLTVMETSIMEYLLRNGRGQSVLKVLEKYNMRLVEKGQSWHLQPIQ
jgi:hypothetical protein